MATDAPAAPSPTILSEPPPAPPPAPEAKLFTPPDPEPPATPAAETPPVPPQTPPVADTQPPAAPQDKQPSNDKPPTDAKKPEVPATPATPPTDYDLKLPDGSLLSPEDLAAIQKQSKDAGLNKEQAEGILTAKNEAVKSFADRQQQSVAQVREQWKQDCAKDPVIGGEKFAENVELARRGFNAVADLELQKLSDSTGFGNHPAVVRAFAKLGRMIAEDKLVRGSVGAVPAKKAPEEILFGGPPHRIDEAS